MFAKAKSIRVGFAVLTAAEFMLVFSLVGLDSASAETVFKLSGTLPDGAALSGTLTIDTIVASNSAVSSANISIGAPDSDVCTQIINQFTQSAPIVSPFTVSPIGVSRFMGTPLAVPEYFIQIMCKNSSLVVTLPNDAGGDLLGYGGGATDAATSSYGGSHLAATLTPLFDQQFIMWFFWESGGGSRP